MKAACRASQPRDCMRPQEQEAQEQEKGLETGFKLLPMAAVLRPWGFSPIGNVKEEREMNKRMIRSAGLATLALGTALAAQAQSSVTLYGRVVAGVDYQSNVYDPATGGSGSLWRAVGNQWGTSMLGFKGEEDLGGGLHALFTLESGFSIDDAKFNGAGFFNRRTFVGLRSGWGTLKLGKDLSISDAHWALDPTGQQFIGSATLVRGRNWGGHDNMISYETPSWGGLRVLALTGLGEQPQGASRLRKDALSVSYTAPTFELRAIYDVARDANGRFSDLYTTSRNLTLGGTITLSALKLFAGYEQLSAPDSAAGVPNKARQYWMGARYKVSGPLTLIGAGYRTTVNNGGGSANLFMAGADYALSKRTLLYASVGNVRNGGNANFSVETTNNNPAPGGSQTGFYVGMAHSF